MVSLKVFKLNYKLIMFVFIFILLISFLYVFSNVKAKQDSGVSVPIIMYHSVLKSKSGDYIVHPSTLEKDLVYIKEKGYTTITMTDLINYVYEDSPLPEKPIIITCDDGHYNNLGYAVPLFKKYNMKAVISIVGKYTDDFSKTD